MRTQWIATIVGLLCFIILTACAESLHQMDVGAGNAVVVQAPPYPYYRYPGYWGAPFGFYSGFYGLGYGYRGYPYGSYRGRPWGPSRAPFAGAPRSYSRRR